MINTMPDKLFWLSVITASWPGLSRETAETARLF